MKWRKRKRKKSGRAAVNCRTADHEMSLLNSQTAFWQISPKDVCPIGAAQCRRNCAQKQTKKHRNILVSILKPRIRKASRCTNFNFQGLSFPLSFKLVQICLSFHQYHHNNSHHPLPQWQLRLFFSSQGQNLRPKPNRKEEEEAESSRSKASKAVTVIATESHLQAAAAKKLATS